MNRKLIALTGMAALLLGGCATVVNGVHQDLSFASDPDGAEVALSSGQSCTTPCEYSLRRGNDMRVDFTKPGYKSEHVYVQSRLAGSTFGNIILGGGIGAVVDGSNGSSNRLYPNPVSIRLVPEGSSDQAVLLDEGGAVISTVAEYNATVEADVLKGMAEHGQIESPAEAD